VSQLVLCGQFNEDGSSIQATLNRAPLTAASGFPTTEAMATVASSGASDVTQCFRTTAISNAIINNDQFQYFVTVVVPDNDGVNFTSIVIAY
jgi:hypothetical protein